MNLIITRYLKTIKSTITKFVAVAFLMGAAADLSAQKVFELKVDVTEVNLDDVNNALELKNWQRIDDNSLKQPEAGDFKDPNNVFNVDYQKPLSKITITCNNGEMFASLILKAYNKLIELNSTKGVNFSNLYLQGQQDNPISVNIEGGISTISNLEMKNLTVLYVKNNATININKSATLEGNISFIAGQLILQDEAKFNFNYGRIEFLHPSTHIEGKGNAAFITSSPGPDATKQIYFCNPGGMENGIGQHFQFANAANITLPDFKNYGDYHYSGGYGSGFTGSLMPGHVRELSTSFYKSNQTLTLTNDITTDKLILYGSLILGDKNFNLTDKDIFNIVPFGVGFTPNAPERMIVTNGKGKMTIENFTGEAVFPLAHTTNLGLNYMPLKINNFSGPAESFTVSVADNVQFPYDQDQYKAVTATWFIEEGTVGGNFADLSFQWNVNEMEPGFSLADAQAAHFNENDVKINLLTSKPQAPDPNDNLYRLLVTENVSSFSPWSILSPFTPLPVKLISFDATLKGSEVALTWSTATESNNNRFEIERKVNDGVFTKIGEVKGSGNSDKKIDYSFINDVKGLDGIIYFRLKQVDEDNKATLSSIKSVKLNSAKNSITVWPNPFIDNVRVNVNANEAGSLQVRIINTEGRVVSNTNYTAKKGTNEFSLNNLGNLSKGIYTVEVIGNGSKEVYKIIK